MGIIHVLSKFSDHRHMVMTEFCLVELMVSFLLSRVPFPGGVYPAGIAYLLLSRNDHWLRETAVLIGFFAGTSSHTDYAMTLALSGALMAYKLTPFFWPRLPRKGNWHLALIWLGLRIVAGLGDFSVDGWAQLGLETGLVFGLLHLLERATKYAGYPLIRSKWALGCFWCLILLAISGTQGFTFFSLAIPKVLAVSLMMVVSYLGGGGIGALMGISSALILSLTMGWELALIALFAVCGMMGGCLRELGKWGTIIGSCLGMYLMITQLEPRPEMMEYGITWGIGSMALFVIPRRYLSLMSGYLPEDVAREAHIDEQKRLENLITERLNEVATTFEAISTEILEQSENDDSKAKADLYTMLDQVCYQSCRHCSGYESCWGTHFYATYREIFDLIAQAEVQGEIHTYHLSGRLAKECFQQFKLINTINQLVERFQSQFANLRSLKNGQLLITSHLQGVSDFMRHLAGQVTRDGLFKQEVEGKLKMGLNRIGLQAEEIAISSFGDHGLEIGIRGKNCKRRYQCQELIAPLVSQILGADYLVWEKRCHLDKDECGYCLIPQRTYHVKTTVCKLPKAGNESSGDSQALHELKEGYFVVILSDGMGHGSQAALESNSTIQILERLLDTGIDRHFAVKMVNSMMALRTPAESFATVDLAMINLYSGAAEFLKVGAAATYVKRGREVWTIKSTSLPAGILNTVDVEKTATHLQAGDFIIMVSDGVIDSRMGSDESGDWLIRALSKVEVTGPEALGEYVLNLAKINQDGQPKDDMTVIVVELIEHIGYDNR